MILKPRIPQIKPPELTKVKFGYLLIAAQKVFMETERQCLLHCLMYSISIRWENSL